jgi:hypothetical protein
LPPPPLLCAHHCHQPSLGCIALRGNAHDSDDAGVLVLLQHKAQGLLYGDAVAGAAWRDGLQQQQQHMQGGTSAGSACEKLGCNAGATGGIAFGHWPTLLATGTADTATNTAMADSCMEVMQLDRADAVKHFLEGLIVGGAQPGERQFKCACTRKFCTTTSAGSTLCSLRTETYGLIQAVGCCRGVSMCCPQCCPLSVLMQGPCHRAAMYTCTLHA